MSALRQGTFEPQIVKSNNVVVTYLDAPRELKSTLLAVRGALVSLPAAPHEARSDDPAPDFSPPVGNKEMPDILVRRWDECLNGVSAEAHLAAIVMMGGFRISELYTSREGTSPRRAFGTQRLFDLLAGDQGAGSAGADEATDALAGSHCSRVLGWAGSQSE